ncbi:MAG: F420-nonreducing hydrogenase [Methanobacterium sp.]|uniref:NADH-quinone oxidoreductase subunit B family protein n=1 Tax=Methanobacterium sp. TaxID=2164 RepID=UPI003D65B38E|nr:F420-nonreducing hydrogenase [Methanobacterium sp.]
MAEKIKLGSVWLGCCSGCELSIADIHEAIVDVLGLADFEFMPVLMDVKYDEWTDVDVAIVTGGIRNEENLELAKKVREKAGLVMAYGTCAVYGGIFGLGNLHTVDDLTQEAYVNSESTYNDEGIIPHDGVPKLESRHRALTDVIDVDLALPGCPPRSDVVAQIVMALLKGEELPEIPNTNLCEVCPREKPPEGMAMDKIIRQFELGMPDDDVCLVTQGLVCMGPATMSLCGAECPSIAIQCRGCYGPTSKVMDQGAKMISAIGSDFGIEHDKTVDPEAVADQLDDVVGTFYTYTLPASLVPFKVKKEGK